MPLIISGARFGPDSAHIRSRSRSGSSSASTSLIRLDVPASRPLVALTTAAGSPMKSRYGPHVLGERARRHGQHDELGAAEGVAGRRGDAQPVREAVPGEKPGVLAIRAKPGRLFLRPCPQAHVVATPSQEYGEGGAPTCGPDYADPGHARPRCRVASSRPGVCRRCGPTCAPRRSGAAECSLCGAGRSGRSRSTRTRDTRKGAPGPSATGPSATGPPA